MTAEHRASLLAGFPRERTWLLPALQAVQHAERWLSPEALGAVAEHLRVPHSEVWGVATHYPEFRVARPGRNVLRVCTGVSCRIRGSLDLLARLEGRLRVRAGETTPDGEVTLEAFDCAFNCSMAPIIELEGRAVGRAELADAERLLEQLAPPHAEADEDDAPGTAGFIPFPTPTPSPIPRGQELSDASRARGPVRWLAAIGRAARALAPPPGPRLAVEVGSCSLAAGAAATLAALAEEAGRRGLPVRVVATGCSGLCWAAPVVRLVGADGSVALAAGVTAGRAGGLLDDVVAGRLRTSPEIEAWSQKQRRVLTERCGITDPRDTADAIRGGSYAALANALAEGRPEAVIETVKAARLQGRGGAYFQAALKWEGARRARGAPKYLVVNAEEGEPGIFKDRHLLEGDPHRLLEGALLAAYAAGASHVILYVHGEAHLAARRLTWAVEDLRHWGLVSRHVLGSDFSVEVEVRRGAGGFVLGEETALMESIEGRRAMPRAKPPFPVDSGLWGRPTVINNVETLFAVPLIVARGAEWWTALGGGHGTKCFGLSGHLRRPGMVEVEMGVTLRTLVHEIGGGLGGGAAEGGALKAALVGGPSGILVPPSRLDEPMLPGGVANPGTGGVVALGPSVSLRDVVRTLLDFNTRESCGKCTPCREGTARLRDMLDGEAPLGSASAPGTVAAAIGELAEVVRLASLCGLGQLAPLSLQSALRDFPSEMSGSS